MKIFYFDTAGRAETARIMLTLAGIAFEDVRFSGEEWAAKYKALSPTGQCPMLESDEGDIIAQSSAINVYVATKTGFMPTDEVARARVHELAACLEDVRPTTHLSTCDYISRAFGLSLRACSRVKMSAAVGLTFVHFLHSRLPSAPSTRNASRPSALHYHTAISTPRSALKLPAGRDINVLRQARSQPEASLLETLHQLGLTRTAARHSAPSPCSWACACSCSARSRQRLASRTWRSGWRRAELSSLLVEPCTPNLQSSKSWFRQPAASFTWETKCAWPIFY